MNEISKSITNLLFIWYNRSTKQFNFNSFFVKNIYIMIHNINDFNHKYKKN